MIEWQPIESAPKDGTRVLLWDGDQIDIASWQRVAMSGGDDWVIFTIADGNWSHPLVVLDPTHWTALPAAPSKG